MARDVRVPSSPSLTVSHAQRHAIPRSTYNKLTAFVSSRGFDVTPHYLGIPTAWLAVFSHTSSLASGHRLRIIGANPEMDALPGVGHACGHNLIAIAGSGVALAMKVALEKHNVSGKVVLLDILGV